MLANRDELYRRPALPVHHWEDHPDILGGRDLVAGGSWLAVNSVGHLAAITNYRERPIQKGKRSRGELITQYLSQNISAADYLDSVIPKATLYAGFNLLLADSSGLYYYSNRSENVQSFLKLKPGYYGLCNHQLDTPWPKLIKTKQLFQNYISDNPTLNPESLIQLMHDEEKVADHLLPDTGVGLETEQLLSSPFISSRDYGTRNTSLLVFDQNNQLTWTEQNYSSYGRKREKLTVKMPLNTS